DDAPPAPGPRPVDDRPGDVRGVARAPEVRDLAVGPVGPSDPGAGDRPLRALLPGVPLVPHSHGRAVRRDHPRALALPQARQVRHLDPGDDAGPGDGLRHGHPGAFRAHHRVRDRRRDGGGERRAVRTAGRRHPDDGLRLHRPRLHRGRGRRHGQPWRLDPGRDLHQPGRGLRRARRQPRPGGDRLLRCAGGDHALPPDRPVCTDAEMTAPSLTEGWAARGATGYWVGFAIVLALLAAAPLVLPPFWQRFVTEILIWGLLAMSSDILIGYT